MGVQIISTGGTARHLQEVGIPITLVSETTDFPEIMDGRVKTLHPAVHAGILADRANRQHMEAIQELGIEPIDLVVVNLYPFEQTVEQEGVEEAEVIENIDIGGPTLVRAAAKNFTGVAVVVDPHRYDDCLLYTSDAADDLLCVDLGGRRIIKKKNKNIKKNISNT